MQSLFLVLSLVCAAFAQGGWSPKGGNKYNSESGEPYIVETLPWSSKGKPKTVNFRHYNYYRVNVENVPALNIQVTCVSKSQSFGKAEIVVGNEEGVLIDSPPLYKVMQPVGRNTCDVQTTLYDLSERSGANDANVIWIGIYGYGKATYQISFTNAVVEVQQIEQWQVNDGMLPYSSWSPAGYFGHQTHKYQLFKYDIPDGIQDIKMTLIGRFGCQNQYLTAKYAWQSQMTNGVCNPLSKGCTTRPQVKTTYVYRNTRYYYSNPCTSVAIPNSAVSDILWVAVDAQACGKGSPSSSSGEEPKFHLTLLLNGDGKCAACAVNSDCSNGYVCDYGSCEEQCGDVTTCPAGFACAEQQCVPV